MKFWDRYRKPIFITENGLGTYDILTSDKKIHDDYRIKYLKEYIDQIVNVLTKVYPLLDTPHGDVLILLVLELLKEVNVTVIYM